MVCRFLSCRAVRCGSQDKPWAHPDPPAAESWGFGGGRGGGGESDDSLREGRLRTSLFIIVVFIIVAIWVFRKFVKRDRNPFFYVPPTPSEEAQVSEEVKRRKWKKTSRSRAGMVSNHHHSSSSRGRFPGAPFCRKGMERRTGEKQSAKCSSCTLSIKPGTVHVS